MLDRPRSGERALLLHIGLTDRVSTTRPRNSERSRNPLAREVVGEIQARRDRPDPKYFVGSGKVDEIGCARARNAGRADPRESAAASRPGAQPRAGAENARARPQRADPRHLRAARRDVRRQAAGRACAARASRLATGARLDPPRAAEGRHRLARSWRDAARNGPAAREPAHPPPARPSRARRAAARGQPQGAAARRCPDRRARRLHERRQDDAVQRVGGRQSRRQGSAVRHPRSDGSAPVARSRCRVPCSWTPSVSFATCRTSSSRRSAPR